MAKKSAQIAFRWEAANQADERNLFLFIREIIGTIFLGNHWYNFLGNHWYYIFRKSLVQFWLGNHWYNFFRNSLVKAQEQNCTIKLHKTPTLIILHLYELFPPPLTYFFLKFSKSPPPEKTTLPPTKENLPQ